MKKTIYYLRNINKFSITNVSDYSELLNTIVDEIKSEYADLNVTKLDSGVISIKTNKAYSLEFENKMIGLANKICIEKNQKQICSFLKVRYYEYDSYDYLDKLSCNKEFLEMLDAVKNTATILEKTNKIDRFFKYTFLINYYDEDSIKYVMDKIINMLKETNIFKADACYATYNIEPNRNRFQERKKDSDIKYNLLKINAGNNKIDSNDVECILNEYSYNNALSLPIIFVNEPNKKKFDFLVKDLQNKLNIKYATISKMTTDDSKSVAKELIDSNGYTINDAAMRHLMSILSRYSLNDTIGKISKAIDEVIFYKLERNDVTNEIRISSLSVLRKEKIRKNPLDELVGLDNLKEVLYSIVCAKKYSNIDKCMHMIFSGNPGTGKTTAARIVAEFLYDNGVLKENKLIEKNARELCGSHIGETRLIVQDLCKEAYDGVLFIDEAYSLATSDSPRDYGNEVLSTLMTEMENNRDRLLIIFAGYTEEMKKMIKANPGLKSRVPYLIDFASPSKEDLFSIFVNTMSSYDNVNSDVFDLAKIYINNMPKSFINSRDFGNGRFIRNLSEKLFNQAALRVSLSKKRIFEITKEDFNSTVSKKEFNYKAECDNFGF